jgi:hypothetical protein
MRPSNKSRSRNKPGGSHNNQRRGGGGGGNMGNVANRVFESAGPDGKVRGTPQQIIDKYQALARDAQLSGDRVIAENYLQHSEHYSRLLGEATRHLNEQRAAQQERENVQQQRPDQQGGDDDGDQGGRDARQNRERQSDEGRQDRDDRQNARHDRDDRQNRDTRRDERNASDDQPRDAQPRNYQPRDDHGLTTIDPTDDRDESGPVETPEGRRRNARVTRPAEREDGRPSEGEAASDVSAAPQEAGHQPVKRPRTRRKAKTETDAETAALRAD